MGLCSTYNVEVLQWCHDLAVKIFPVLWVNSNRLVQIFLRFRQVPKSDKKTTQIDQHVDYSCQKGAQMCRNRPLFHELARPCVPPQKTELFPWAHDLGIKIVPVLLINSNRMG